MREILFRGKRFCNGEWVYGFYHNETSRESPSSDRKATRHHIYTQEFDVFVDPETIGQYTGLTDKNGTKIFEGDIFGDSKGQEVDVVVFEDGCFKLKSFGFIEYCLDGNAYEERWGELECEPICNFCLEHDEILGNIYDNPELLGGVNE